MILFLIVDICATIKEKSGLVRICWYTTDPTGFLRICWENNKSSTKHRDISHGLHANISLWTQEMVRYSFPALSSWTTSSADSCPHSLRNCWAVWTSLTLGLLWTQAHRNSSLITAVDPSLFYAECKWIRKVYWSILIRWFSCVLLSTLFPSFSYIKRKGKKVAN